MTSLVDLSPCTHLPVQAPTILAIGWLGRNSHYERASVSETFFSKLESLASEPWQAFISAGIHRCELCQFNPPGFGANLFIPHDGVVYVAPVGVVHYIAAHWYKPPERFIAAVLECPAMRSMAYKKALLANGGRALVGLVMSGHQIMPNAE